MSRVSASGFTTVRSEGGLLPPDLLARIGENDSDLKGFAPDDFGLDKGERLNEATARAWERVKSYWAAFSAARESLVPNESGVTETREQWLLPLFRELGYGRLTFRQGAEEIDGRRYPISHQAGDALDAPPMHLVSFGTELDRPASAAAGQPRTSPHGLLQEYLNRTDHLWGIVSNGKRLRLLRDNLRLSRAAYVEFDLEAMLDGGVYADFALLFLLAHRSRLPQPGAKATECWLERWREAAEERGKRALDELRAGVETAIRALGQGMLEHSANQALRDRLASGALPVTAYYRQLLRLVYRLLFLLAAEERNLLFEPEIDVAARERYARFYGVARLRELVAQRRHRDRYDDLWRSLQLTFRALVDPETGAKLGLKPLAGGLFGPESCPDLDLCLIANTALLDAIRGLTFTQAGTGEAVRRINYRDMDVEELGSVYEGLLEQQPELRTTGERPHFGLGMSGERKTTGSYYTNPGLVRELIVSALEPVIADALARGKTPAEQRRELLELKVCDPACGSGHFLLAAARRIGREIARIDAAEAEPDPTLSRHATREAIAHCVYGVDLNPLAVDLCKLALWLEAHEPGRPIGFLDHHIRQGNSLVGATEAAMAEGIPDDVFEPVTGDDKKIAAAVKKRNRQERTGQQALAFDIVEFKSDSSLRAYYTTMEESEETVAEVEAKAAAYKRHTGSGRAWRKRLQADLWTAAAFWPLQAGAPEAPTQATWARLCADPHLTDYITRGKADAYRTTAAYQSVTRARQLAKAHSFFHWELEFDDVFSRPAGGFDCILGNPPWEQIQPEEQKFFAIRAPEIASAAGATRKRMIEKLPTTDPILWNSWIDQVREMEQTSVFVRRSGIYPLTGNGKINTYPAFSERFYAFISGDGMAGIIVPDGIATNATNAQFFAELISNKRIKSLYGFKNERFLFSGVEHTVTFALLTIGGSKRTFEETEYCWLAWTIEEMQRPDRRVRITPQDIDLFNPNTKTCPIFRSQRDAELTKRIYQAAPVLLREDEAGNPISNPWGITLKQGLFNMTSDSHLFRTREELEQRGLRLGSDGRFRGNGETWLPLYEAKMIHQYDHRFATYDGPTTRDVTLEEHMDPDFTVLPRYWVAKEEVEKAAGGKRSGFLGFRDIARNTDERTCIVSALPFVAVGHTLPIVSSELDASKTVGLLANLDALVLDYASRQKVGGTHLTFFIVKQLPLISPQCYTRSLLEEIAPRVIELSYTAYDIEAFAHETGYDGPPFIWDETRRAHLRAELDGIYAHLYKLSRDDFAYILDTFPIVRRDDEAAYGEYRTKRLCLEAYDRFAGQL